MHSSRRPQCSFTPTQQSPCQLLAPEMSKSGMLTMWESTHCLLLLVGMALHCLGGITPCTSGWTGQAFVWGSWKRRICLDAHTDADVDTDADADIFKTHFYILFFIPNTVFTAVFASRPRRRSCHSAYPFISARAKD